MHSLPNDFAHPSVRVCPDCMRTLNVPVDPYLFSSKDPGRLHMTLPSSAFLCVCTCINLIHLHTAQADAE